jgi:ribosome-binding protein aMBF1 (putative translation factor)
MSSKNIKSKNKSEERMKDILDFKNEQEKEEFELKMLSLQIVNAISDVMQYYGWNKAKLAEEMGTSKSYITQLFKGDKIVNLNFIAKLKRILKIKLNISFVLSAGNEINLVDKNTGKFISHQSYYKTNNTEFQRVAEKAGEEYLK